MADQRDGGIGWTDETWNPIRGCRRVSPGCENCYAERMAGRFCGESQPYEGLVRLHAHDMQTGEMRWNGKVRMVPEHLDDPLHWRRPRRVFVNSMSDLFHEGLSNEDIAAVFGVMAVSPKHTFQVLTKRAERMRDWFRWVSGGFKGPTTTCIENMERIAGDNDLRIMPAWPLPNVWIGVSVENQKYADKRIPLLLETPAAVRFVSYEPALGPADFGRWLRGRADCKTCGSGVKFDEDGCCAHCGADAELHCGLDWVIFGAESGPSARPCDPDWARSVRDQCQASGTAFFLKQFADAHGKKIPHPELDGRTWQEYPRCA